MSLLKSSVIVFAISAFAVTAFAEPKAYDVVKYSGKTADGLTIAFDFADGYPQASEIKITTPASGKDKGTTTTFALDNDSSGEDSMYFGPGRTGVNQTKPNGGKQPPEFVVLQMSMDGEPQNKVEGVYHNARGETKFKLTKR